MAVVSYANALALLADIQAIHLSPGRRVELYALAAIVGVVVLFLAVFLVACLCERQFLSGDVEPVGEPFPYTPSKYWQATRDAAVRLGLQHAGDFATRKGTSLVKGLQSLFISPDSQILASISSSASAIGKLKRTVLRTRIANGRVLESTDNPGTEDMSGVVDRALLLNAGVEELLKFHQQRILTSGSAPVNFNPSAALAEFERIDLERGTRWVMMGMARWADPQHTSIRMTVRGAFTHVKNLIKQTGKLGEQQHRSHIRRAGSRAAGTNR